MIAARAAFLVLFVGGTAAAQGKSPVVTPLAQTEVVKLAPKVRSIHAEPATITLRVGETVGLDKIVVTVLDSMGNVRGRLVGYDFSIAPGQAASAMPFKITGEKPGTTELVIHYPRSSWAPRKDPRAEVKVQVVVKG